MADEAQRSMRRRNPLSRVAVWTAAACILLVPVIAMQFTDEVNWSASDFIIFGAMLLVAGFAVELAQARSASPSYRAGSVVAVAAAFLLVWVNLAVGIVGSEDNPANLIFFGVIAVAIVGAAVARLRASGMVRALHATALAQGVAGVCAFAFARDTARPAALLALTCLFAALWLAAAWLFGKAAAHEK